MTVLDWIVGLVAVVVGILIFSRIHQFTGASRRLIASSCLGLAIMIFCGQLKFDVFSSLIIALLVAYGIYFMLPEPPKD